VPEGDEIALSFGMSKRLMTERKGEIHSKLKAGLRGHWDAANERIHQAKMEEARRAEELACACGKDEDANSEYLSKGSNVSSHIAIRRSGQAIGARGLAGKPAPLPAPRVERLCR